jgi:hypothetical protein
MKQRLLVISARSNGLGENLLSVAEACEIQSIFGVNGIDLVVLA